MTRTQTCIAAVLVAIAIAPRARAGDSMQVRIVKGQIKELQEAVKLAEEAGRQVKPEWSAAKKELDRASAALREATDKRDQLGAQKGEQRKKLLAEYRQTGQYAETTAARSKVEAKVAVARNELLKPLWESHPYREAVTRRDVAERNVASLKGTNCTAAQMIAASNKVLDAERELREMEQAALAEDESYQELVKRLDELNAALTKLNAQLDKRLLADKRYIATQRQYDQASAYREQCAATHESKREPFNKADRKMRAAAAAHARYSGRLAAMQAKLKRLQNR